jgi:hypothetical protein
VPAWTKLDVLLLRVLTSRRADRSGRLDTWSGSSIHTIPEATKWAECTSTSRAVLERGAANAAVEPRRNPSDHAQSAISGRELIILPCIGLGQCSFSSYPTFRANVITVTATESKLP